MDHLPGASSVREGWDGLENPCKFHEMDSLGDLAESSTVEDDGSSESLGGACVPDDARVPSSPELVFCPRPQNVFLHKPTSPCPEDPERRVCLMSPGLGKEQVSQKREPLQPLRRSRASFGEASRVSAEEIWRAKQILLRKNHWARTDPMEKAQTFSADAIAALSALNFPNQTYSSVLPTVGTGRSDAILRITTETVAALLESRRGPAYKLIDCRFAYEYNGGHIRYAANLEALADIASLFGNAGEEDGGAEGESRVILVFYCEYSSMRAPRLALYLRNEDRKRNVYPKLKFPNVYVMQGGYKEFFRKHPAFCEPMSYIPMDDPGRVERPAQPN